MLLNKSELAIVVGLSMETLDHYQSAGLIRSVVTGSNPLFGPETRTRLEIIAKGKQLGFTLSEIKRLIDAPNATPAVNAPTVGDRDEEDREGSNGPKQ